MRPSTERFLLGLDRYRRPKRIGCISGVLKAGYGLIVKQAGTAPILGRFTTTFDCKSNLASYIDSGTETYLLHDDDLPRCGDMA